MISSAVDKREIVCVPRCEQPVRAVSEPHARFHGWPACKSLKSYSSAESPISNRDIPHLIPNGVTARMPRLIQPNDPLG